ncbi:acid-sensing ion channel 1-like [Micropterus dolomieu]|uniref:acid-sensing ion channel 1-like n=1 Tax=Micropterus dolomieu TaxID=147949 RepID=UPI001E8E7636|nr:acid-sensing ion channel 1-like [Micropterus dolomieu]
MDLKTDSEDMDYKRPAPIEVFASRSTLHGISHMFTYERMCIKRSLWILFFLGSVGVLVMVCVDRVQFYFQYPHVTKLDEVAAPMMVFPSVTFCNLNSFRFSRVTRNDLYHAGELLALLNGRYEIRDPHLVEENVLQILKERADFDNYKPRPFNMREFYDRTGHDIKDMLLSCFYRGMDCSAEDFKVVSQACQLLNVLCRAAEACQDEVQIPLFPLRMGLRTIMCSVTDLQAKSHLIMVIHTIYKAAMRACTLALVQSLKG